MNPLIKQLETYRLENKISQEKIAELLGVYHSTVHRWFKGTTIPNKIQKYHIRKLISRKRKK